MTPRDERGREQVRMRVTLSFDYMAPIDPAVYEGSTDPHRMAAIDAANSPEALIEFAGRRPVLVSVEPVLDAAPSLPVGGGDGRRWTIHVCPHCSALCASDDWDDAPCDCPDDGDILTVLVAPVSSSAGDDPDPVELGYGDTDLFAGPAGDEAREALERARASVQDASEMQCRCTGYYRCLGCEREVAEAAGEALEDIDAALAALSSPLPGAGDGRSLRWFRVTNGFDGPVPLEDRHRTYEAAAAELSRLDREFPAYAPFKVQTQVETHSGWVDAPAPADDKETTR